MTDLSRGAPRWIMARSGRQRLALAALSGLAGGLGQAPFDLWYLAVPGFAGLLLLTSLAPTPRRAMLTAWVGAMAYFALSLHWIMEPFFVDAPRYGWMAPFGLFFLAGGLALFWMVPAWLAARLVPQGRAILRTGGLTGLVLLAEGARATILTGFPWAHPGHVLIDTPLLGLAGLIGPHGLNLLVLGYAALIAVVALRFGARVVPLAFVPIVVLLFLPQMRPLPPTGPDAPIVRLIQPNAPQHLKWQPDMIPVFFQRALDLTAAASETRAPDLIVWPETTLPELLGRSEQSRARIAAASGDAMVLLGAQRFAGLRPRNTSALLSADGEILQIYDKHHLVPFGEYLPLDAVWRRLGLAGIAETLPGGYTPGPGPQVLNLGRRLGVAFPMICYEAIFPHYIHSVPRPDWIVHLTNDAWFGEFSGPYQHLALARLRAVEQGLPVLRAANTGVSAVIDGRGQVTAALPLGEAGFLDAALPAALPAPLYARTGDWPVWLLVFLATATLIATSRRVGPLHPAA